MGVPVVTSRVAAGGVDAVAGEHLLVAPTPAEYARRDRCACSTTRRSAQRLARGRARAHAVAPRLGRARCSGSTASSSAASPSLRAQASLQTATVKDRIVNISIFGLGYVGAVSLACLARDGHRVIGVDIDPAKLELIRAGKTPVVEEGMVELMATVAASGRVSRDAPTSRRPCCDTELSLDLRRHAVGAQRQPGPVGDAAPRARSSARAMRGQADAARLRVPLDARARHGRGRAAADHRARVGQEGRRWTSTSASSPSSCAKARRSATTTSRRSRSSAPTRGGRCAALRELFGHLPCEFHRDLDPRRGDGQVLLQQLPRAEDHVRQRDGAPVRGAGRRSVRGDGPGVQGHAAQHLAGLSEAGLRVRRLVPAQGPARDACTSPRCTTSSCRCTARILQSNRAHIDHAIAKVLATRQAAHRHDRALVQDRHRRSAREPAGAAGRAPHRQGAVAARSTIPKCTCRVCSAQTGASSSSTCRTSAR